jgi:hypothetical protein
MSGRRRARPHSAAGRQLNFRSILLQSVEIKAIENNDFDIWLPLWKGYQRFYEVAQPDERNVRHWMGPDAFESRTRSHGHYGKQTLRCVRGRTSLVSRPFASLHGDEQVSVVPRKAAVHAFSRMTEVGRTKPDDERLSPSRT